MKPNGLQTGDRIGSVYEVVRHLAAGGLSHVYLVKRRGSRDGISPLWIAKRMRTDAALKEVLAKDMLRAEIDVLKRLEHPGLMRVDDVVYEAGHLYMIAEYIRGETLEEVIQRRGVLSEEAVYDIALQLCDVLGYLHSRRRTVLYRDLKPANIMLRDDGSVVLIDFGTAMLSGRAFLTDKTPMGTKGYAAPEQYDGTEHLSDGTDVYALGKTLTALLNGGKTTFRGLRGVSPAFRQILRGCTRRSRAKRYRSVAEVSYALRTGKAKTTGYLATREVKRGRETAARNGVFRLNRLTHTGAALSYADIEIPLDEPATDVRMGLHTNAVQTVEMDGFVVERDEMVSMRENYRLTTLTGIF